MKHDLIDLHRPPSLAQTAPASRLPGASFHPHSSGRQQRPPPGARIRPAAAASSTPPTVRLRPVRRGNRGHALADRLSNSFCDPNADRICSRALDVASTDSARLNASSTPPRHHDATIARPSVSNRSMHIESLTSVESLLLPTRICCTKPSEAVRQTPKLVGLCIIDSTTVLL